ncbi:hypothetical protein AFLA_000787 [Aspergillus flavus NRRL3357]|nr:hypothetical protein AFLA_000787 [Aspergillus flavus NRRL3357]
MNSQELEVSWEPLDPDFTREEGKEKELPRVQGNPDELCGSATPYVLRSSCKLHAILTPPTPLAGPYFTIDFYPVHGSVLEGVCSAWISLLSEVDPYSPVGPYSMVPTLSSVSALQSVPTLHRSTSRSNMFLR